MTELGSNGLPMPNEEEILAFIIAIKGGYSYIYLVTSRE